MPISIKNSETESLARELARETGETITEALTAALRERLTRLRGRRTADFERDAVEAICRRCSQLPDIDGRSADEILGYNDRGAFD